MPSKWQPRLESESMRVQQREAARAQQMICTVEFLQKLFTADDVTKYRGIPVSRHFLRRYIIVGHFLMHP